MKKEAGHAKIVLKERGDSDMNNLILFVNSFLSYLLVMVIIAVIAGAAAFIGIKARKNKDAKAAQTEKIEEQ